jgi:hypothetical protein
MGDSTKAGGTLPLNDASQWPLRMTRRETAHVLRISVRHLARRISSGLFPQPDGGSRGTWARDVVERYVKGGIREFDKRAERDARRKPSPK